MLSSAAIALVLAITTVFADSQYGSGFFVQSEGYLITNYHVVESAEEIMVATSEGERFPAELVRFDDRKDLALLKIEKPESPVLGLNFSHPVRVLEPVVAIGFPYADRVGMELSAYDGKVNAIRESGLVPLIQMDASVNSGSSGGPVLNDRGHVVGVTVSKFDAVQTLLEKGDIPERINFAIPISEAKGVLSEAFPFGHGELPDSQAMSPTEIFESAKRSVVLVVARVPQSDKPDSNSREDGPTDTAESLSTSQIDQFVGDFVSASNSGSNLEIGTFFAESVVYMDQGSVSLDLVKGDHAKHQARWPVRKYKLKSRPEISYIPRGDAWLAEYTVEFAVENKTQIIRGEAVNRLYILNSNPPVIVGLEEELTRRDRVEK